MTAIYMCATASELVCAKFAVCRAGKQHHKKTAHGAHKCRDKDIRMIEPQHENHRADHARYKLTGQYTY